MSPTNQIAADVGVLLINLGTPDAPEPAAVRKYLAEFLSDPRVVEIPAAIWKPVLYGVVLRTRPAKSAKAYREIWTNEGSPLMAISKRQAGRAAGAVRRQHLRRARHALWQSVDRARAVENGRPWLQTDPGRAALSAILRGNDGDRRWMPCSVELESMRSQPAIRTLPPYFDDPLYIEALERSIERQLAANSISRRSGCCSAFTACPSARARWAIPITNSAKRPRSFLPSG